MKTEVSTLTGEALSWLVATCENAITVFTKDELEMLSHEELCKLAETHLDVHKHGTEDVLRATLQSKPFFGNYATDGNLAAVIIEREKIDLYWEYVTGEWRAIKVPDFNEPHYHFRRFGKTFIEAAMRAFVASKLGEEVDVPDELIGGAA